MDLLCQKGFQKKILINVILRQVLPVSLTDGRKSKWRNIHFAKVLRKLKKERNISLGQLGSTPSEEAEPKITPGKEMSL